MILWGGVDEARARSVAESIGDRARLKLTPAPPIIVEGEHYDEATDIVLANTFFSHFVYAAMAKAGRFDLALDLMRERYGSMVERGATTLWEGFEPHASLAHGFSATPTWQLVRHLLGVAPASPGFDRVSVRPHLGSLTFARGVQPTRLGDVEVSLRKSGESYDVEVTLPEATSGELIAPGGYVLEGDSQLAPGRNNRAMRPAR